MALGTYNFDFIAILLFWHHTGFVGIVGFLECVWDILKGRITLAISGKISVCRSIYLRPTDAVWHLDWRVLDFESEGVMDC